jgi:cation transport ATPase
MYFPDLPSGYDAEAASVYRSNRRKNRNAVILMVFLLAASIGVRFLTLLEGWATVWLIVWWVLTVLCTAGWLWLMIALWARLTPRRILRPSAGAKVLATIATVLLVCTATACGYLEWQFLSGDPLWMALAFPAPFVVTGAAIGVLNAAFRR